MIENLLETIDDIKDNEEELIKDETIEEVCIDLTTPKKYFNECDKCGYISNASRRYETCKQILKHKEKCTESKASISGLRKGRGYLPEPFRQIRTYLPEPFRQIRTYLPEPVPAN